MLAALGGLMTLVVALGFAVSSIPGRDLRNTILGTMIVGVLPLLTGFALFVKGARRIHASKPEAPPVIATPGVPVSLTPRAPAPMV
ncbi:MAG TPA: hypothetical protein VKH42_10350, partial [Vicinamibacterales bacterium]|nr:hypothetical protein [Vicinamibacterales bacterium]